MKYLQGEWVAADTVERIVQMISSEMNEGVAIFTPKHSVEIIITIDERTRSIRSIDQVISSTKRKRNRRKRVEAKEQS